MIYNSVLQRCIMIKYNSPYRNRYGTYLDEDTDEPIDMDLYTKDTRDTILTEDVVKDIIFNINQNAMHRDVSNAFRYIRDRDLYMFRTLVSSNTSIVNTKYNNTYLIHEACRLGDLDFVAFLLSHGARCNIIDDNGFMAQHYAVRSKSIFVVDLLVLFGNSMNVVDRYGNTPIYYAVIDGDHEMVKLLTVYKADPMLKDINEFLSSMIPDR